MSDGRLVVSLVLGLTVCLITAAIPTPQTDQETSSPGNNGNHSSLLATAGPSHRLSVTGETMAGSGQDLTSTGGVGHVATARVTTQAPGTTPRTTPTTPRTTPRTTPTTPRVNPTTLRTTPRVNPTTLRTTPRVNPTTSRTTLTPWNPRVGRGPDRTATVVFLVMLFLLLCCGLYCSWRKLRQFGGSGSYYPCRADKAVYVSPEDGEGEARGPSSMGQAFMVAVRNLLPRKPEVEEDDDERAELSPFDGESEGEEEEEEEEGGGSSRGKDEESGQSDSDDYSSLGGCDLRERAMKEEEEGDDLPEPPSTSCEEVLSDLHSFSGTASWTDTNHDITAL